MQQAEGIFADHGPYVLRVLRHLGVPQADLPDVAQDVFIVVFRRLDSFEGRSSLRTWIYGICLRVTADYRKKQRRRRAVFAEDEQPLSLATVAARQLESLGERRRLRQVESALERLSDEQRRAFVLADIEQQSMQQVAATLGCPLKTAFSRLYAARRKVREALGGELDKLLPALCPSAALTQAGDAQRLGAVWREMLPSLQQAAPATLGKGVGGWLAASLACVAALAPAFITPAPLQMAAAERLSERPVPGPHFTQVGVASPAEPSSRHAPRAPRRVAPEMAKPGDQEPQGPTFAVEHQATPSAHLIFLRVALSEVIPYYAVPD